MARVAVGPHRVFGIVFGFLCVARLNICYSRYWEGVTHVKMMHSKWSDAAAQAVAFDRVKSPDCDLTSEPFCHHLVHLFSQLSALATMELHVNKSGMASSGIQMEWLRREHSGSGLGEDSFKGSRTSSRSPSMRRLQLAAFDANGERKIRSTFWAVHMHMCACLL